MTRECVLRFQAQVRTTGVNPYVDVPRRVSEALKAFVEAGRIRVEGRVSEAQFQGTFVPVRGGGHRMYVPGGLRSAAGVEVGDTVVVEGAWPHGAEPGCPHT